MTFNCDTNKLSLTVGGITRTATVDTGSLGGSSSSWFAASTLVEEKEKGFIPVSNVEIGDFVRVSKREFAQIYS